VRRWGILTAALACCPPAEETSEEGVPHRTLVVTDTLGVEIGDDMEMFGEIAGAGFIDPDRIVILDKAMKSLRSYTASGEFIDSTEYEGAGPLEIQNAGHLCPLDGGFAVVEEFLPAKYLVFDRELTPLRYVILEETTPLFESSVLPDSSLVGCTYSIQASGDQLQFGADVCRWNAQGDRDLTYYSEYYPITSWDNASYEIFLDLEFCTAASATGRVYVTPDRRGFDIYVFERDGACIDTLSTLHVLEPRSEEEQHQEMRLRVRRDGADDWSPSVLEPGIVQLQVQDSAGRLWACHGSYFAPEFDVYSLEGELLFTCGCEGLPANEMMRFGITDHGYVAWTMNPQEYPRLFVMELRED
jgi:hypothetical protein